MKPTDERNKPEHYSVSAPPVTIDEAQKAIVAINAEIASMENAIAEKTPKDFRGEEAYDFWLKGINRKKGHFYQERSFLERWIHKTIDQFDVAGRQRRIDGFVVMVQMSRGEFEYVSKYGDECPPDSAPKANSRKEKLTTLVAEVSKKMMELRSTGETDLHLSFEDMEEPLRVFKDLVNEIYREIKCLSAFLKGSRRKQKDAKGTQLFDPNVARPLTEELEGFWTTNPYQRHFAAGVKPVSDDEPGLRLEELKGLIRRGQLHYEEVWEKAKVEPFELGREQFRQLGSSFTQKMGVIQREMAYLREAYPKLRGFGGALPIPTGGKSIQHLHLPMSQIKERVGMNGHDMLLWLVGRIRPGGQLAISKGDAVTFEAICEFVKLVEERVELEYGPERVKELLLPK